MIFHAPWGFIFSCIRMTWQCTPLHVTHTLYKTLQKYIVISVNGVLYGMLIKILLLFLQKINYPNRITLNSTINLRSNSAKYLGLSLTGDLTEKKKTSYVSVERSSVFPHLSHLYSKVTLTLLKIIYFQLMHAFSQYSPKLNQSGTLKKK